VRKTEQRAVILDELRKCRNHPGADELYARVRGRLPRISLATVYRNLELMAARGLIRRLDPAAGSRRFDCRSRYLDNTGSSLVMISSTAGRPSSATLAARWAAGMISWGFSTHSTDAPRPSATFV